MKGAELEGGVEELQGDPLTPGAAGPEEAFVVGAVAAAVGDDEHAAVRLVEEVGVLGDVGVDAEGVVDGVEDHRGRADGARDGHGVREAVHLVHVPVALEREDRLLERGERRVRG